MQVVMKERMAFGRRMGGRIGESFWLGLGCAPCDPIGEEGYVSWDAKALDGSRHSS